MQTRWSDMDIYGHVNNVVYMQYCDAALNRSLIAAGALDLLGSTPIGIVARNSTNYFAEISYPDNVAVGVRVEHIGNTSLLWDLAFSRMAKSWPQLKANMCMSMSTETRDARLR